MLRYERVPIGRAQHRADGGGIEYQCPIFGGPLKEAFKVPRDAISALGNGDADAGLAVCDQMFGDHRSGRGTIHPDLVQTLAMATSMLAVEC